MLGGGGCAGPAFGPISVGGGGGAAKGLLPCFLVPKGDQPTACTLALWWLKFGPTRGSGFRGGGGGLVPGVGAGSGGGGGSGDRLTCQFLINKAG